MDKLKQVKHTKHYLGKVKNKPYLIYFMFFNKELVYIGLTYRYNTYIIDDDIDTIFYTSDRFREHKKDLKNNKHDNTILQKKYNNLISNNIEIDITFDMCDLGRTRDSAYKKENKAINKYLDTCNVSGKKREAIKKLRECMI